MRVSFYSRVVVSVESAVDRPYFRLLKSASILTLLILDSLYSYLLFAI